MRLSRLTDTTVPSYSRVAALAAGAPAVSAAAAIRAVVRSFFMACNIDVRAGKRLPTEGKGSIKGCQAGVG